MVKRKRQKKYKPYLPKEIFFNILSWLPLEFLHNHGKYVCKNWANILRDPKFIKAHILHSSAELFIQHTSFPYLVQFLEFNEERFKFKVTDRMRELPGQILCSSGGVSLFFDMGDVYLANIVTMQIRKLPFPSEVGTFYTWRSSIAHIPRSGEYKVVCPCVDLNKIGHWYVSTVGSDISWRKINITAHEAISQLYRNCKSISAGGVLYYINCLWYFDHNIFAIDTRDETTYYFQVPNELCEGRCWLLRMGNNLCCVVREPSNKVFKVCLLKDLHQNEWTEVYRFKINLIGRSTIWKCHICRPIAWLDSNQILIFEVCRGFGDGDVFIAYNLKTGKWRTIQHIDPYHHKIQAHTNSFVTF